MFDNVFDAIDKDGAFGIFELLLVEVPEVAFFVSDVDCDILPKGWGGDGLVAGDDVARKTVYEGFVFGIVKKKVELIGKK